MVEPKHKFKVGDRVVVYSCRQRWLGQIYKLKNYSGEIFFVEFDDEDNKSCPENTVHYKQCRKLVKKKQEIYFIAIADTPCQDFCLYGEASRSLAAVKRDHPSAKAYAEVKVTKIHKE
jgi:hypothetical protein